MKNAKSLIAALALASASLGSSAVMAQDVSAPSQAIDLVGTSGFFGDAFDAGTAGGTFSDRFTFTVSGTGGGGGGTGGGTGTGSNFDAIVSSFSRTAATGLDITGLTLFSGTGTQISTGTSLQSGAIDVWTITSNNLAAGNYYVQVSGTLVSATSGAFGGAVMLAPVPEPETYGMLLAGLGLVGFMARRRKA